MVLYKLFNTLWYRVSFSLAQSSNQPDTLQNIDLMKEILVSTKNLSMDVVIKLRDISHAATERGANCERSPKHTEALIPSCFRVQPFDDDIPVWSPPRLISS
jgi:hypothetical protein